MKSQAGRSLRGWSVIAAAVALLALPALPAQAQNCGKRQFLYQGCDAFGRVSTKCSECPNDEPGFTPLKRKKPCFRLVQFSPPNITWNDGATTHTMFSGGFATTSVFNAAVGFWDMIEDRSCSQGLQQCSECVLVRLSDDPGDFDHDETLLKKDFRTVVESPFPGTCTDRCSFSNERIFINMTNAHMRDRNGKLKRAPYNSLSSMGAETHPNGFQAVSMEDIMITAMAQFWGFPPQKGAPCGNNTSEPWATDGEVSPSFNPRLVNFSNHDAVICMFRRLYCPGEDPYCFTRAVDENGNEIEASPVEIAVTPNPSDGDDVECIITTELRGDATVAIYDAAGNNVSEPSDLSIEPGSRVYRLKSDLGAGAYILVLSIDGVNHVRRFIVLPK